LYSGDRIVHGLLLLGKSQTEVLQTLRFFLKTDLKTPKTPGVFFRKYVLPDLQKPSLKKEQFPLPEIP